MAGARTGATGSTAPVTGSPLAGAVAAAGGLLFVVWPVFGGMFVDAVGSDPYFPPGSPGYVGYYLAWVPVSLALLVGAVGVHARYGDRLRRPGVVGLSVAGIGFVAMALGAVLNAASAGPADATTAGGALLALGLLGAFLGGALVGVAGLRAGPLARPESALLVVALPALVVGIALSGAFLRVTGTDAGFVVFSVPYGVAWLLLGYRLWTEAA